MVREQIRSVLEVEDLQSVQVRAEENDEMERSNARVLDHTTSSHLQPLPITNSLALEAARKVNVEISVEIRVAIVLASVKVDFSD